MCTLLAYEIHASNRVCTYLRVEVHAAYCRCLLNSVCSCKRTILVGGALRVCLGVSSCSEVLCCSVISIDDSLWSPCRLLGASSA
jgi:hypothetical protein